MSTRRKPPTTVVRPAVKQSAKPAARSKIDESKASVALADPASVEMIEISSDSESNYDDIEDLDEDPIEDDDEDATAKEQALQRKQETTPGKKAVSTRQSRDVDANDAEASDDDAASPTFGDLIRNQETVDVTLAAQPHNPSTALAAPQNRTVAPPSLSSLGTVLSQALRTDDTDLLESCFHTTDLNVVRNTIQRLDSSLAGTLLTKLAARIHRRPGRAHSLMGWIQWTLVAHGGALAGQPDMHKRLVELNRVLEERSRGLNSLLSLKGKLDMLELQMSLRRKNRSRRAAQINGADGSDEEVQERDEAIVYVEGEEEQSPALLNGLRRDDEDDDFPVVNGEAGDSDDDSEDEDMDDVEANDGDLVEESMDEDEVDHHDIEESGEEDESEPEAAAPPPKLQKKTKSPFGKRR